MAHAVVASSHEREVGDVIEVKLSRRAPTGGVVLSDPAAGVVLGPATQAEWEAYGQEIGAPCHIAAWYTQPLYFYRVSID